MDNSKKVLEGDEAARFIEIRAWVEAQKPEPSYRDAVAKFGKFPSAWILDPGSFEATPPKAAAQDPAAGDPPSKDGDAKAQETPDSPEKAATAKAQAPAPAHSGEAAPAVLSVLANADGSDSEPSGGNEDDEDDFEEGAGEDFIAPQSPDLDARMRRAMRGGILSRGGSHADQLSDASSRLAEEAASAPQASAPVPPSEPETGGIRKPDADDPFVADAPDPVASAAEKDSSAEPAKADRRTFKDRLKALLFKAPQKDGGASRSKRKGAKARKELSASAFDGGTGSATAPQYSDPAKDKANSRKRFDSNPYLSARTMYRSRFDQFAAANSWMKILVMIFGFIAVGMFGFNIYLSGQSHIVPYVISVDDHGFAMASGIATPLKYSGGGSAALTGTSSPNHEGRQLGRSIDERVLRAGLTMFISKLRTVTPDVAILRDNIRSCYAMVGAGDPSVQKLDEWFAGEDPDTGGKNPLVRAEKEIVHVRFKSAVTQSENTMLIEWIEESRDRDGARTRPDRLIRATVTWYLGDLKYDVDQIQRNPFGLYIKDFNWTDVK